MIKVRLTNLLAWNRQPFLHVDLFCTISNRRHFSMVSRNVFFARDTDNETLTKKNLTHKPEKLPKTWKDWLEKTLAKTLIKIMNEV